MAMSILTGRRSCIWFHVLLVTHLACVLDVRSQSGFLSIDCGSAQNYTDSQTGIFWETDASYISRGTVIDNITDHSKDLNFLNNGQFGTLRYFTGQRSRECYVLPVKIGQTYLFRATFFYGNLGLVENLQNLGNYSFEMDTDNNDGISIGVTTDTSQWYEPQYYEVIYSAPFSTFDVCLRGYGKPSYISALELRQLSSTMYSHAIGPGLGAYLQMIYRIKCGASETGATRYWRYPQDPFDRAWSLFGSADNFAKISNDSIAGSGNSFTQDPDQPPPVVMEDAWVAHHSNLIQFSLPNVDSQAPLYTAAYFQELDGSASANNVRGMLYFVNNIFWTAINSSGRPKEVGSYGAGSSGYTSTATNPTNITIVQDKWSKLSPILNAFEAYNEYPYDNSSTDEGDVSALNALIIRLNSSAFFDWAGDPCFPIPFDWIQCTGNRITYLNLTYQGLQGDFPPDILNLTAVTSLNIDHNSFSGLLPDLSSLGALTFLSLHHNNFFGPIPNLTNLYHLAYFYIDVNNCSGPLPNLSGLVNLTQVHVNNNFLSGSLPQFINLPSLQDLNIATNQFTGSLSNLSNLTNLNTLQADNNNFTGSIQGLSGLTKLTYISLSHNELNSVLDVYGLSNLKTLLLNDNSFSGTIPEISGLQQLQTLVLSDNSLSGTIPAMSGLQQLQTLELDNNQLSGTISNLTGLPVVQTLLLDNNQLSGSIADLNSLTSLQILDLSNNGFSGTISNMSALLNLQTLKLDDNQFSGSIANLSGLQNVQVLDLNNNNFSDSIPDFTNLTNLKYLRLENNDLSGDIPNYLGMLPNLTQLDLDYNNLSGKIPANLLRTGLNFSVLNNSGIIDCGVPACGGPFPVPSSSGTGYSAKSSGGRANTAVVVGALLGSLAVVVIVAGATYLICTRKRRSIANIIKSMDKAGGADNQGGSTPTSTALRRAKLAGSMTLLTLQEVSNVTNKFDRKLGEGSFGPVYYGKLSSGQEVAVKVKSIDSRQGIEEFTNEVELLSRIHHRNLVSLVGYCEEAERQILIYAYVPNGSLFEHLFDEEKKKALNWKKRLDISLDSAKGLEYLHTACTPRIIHRDVKSNNILLDENLVAKVADFGLSKQAPEGVFSAVDTLLKGTPGYIDPEYFMSQRLTQKSDVFSFGVVLLEMITGRHHHLSTFPDGTTGTLIQWLHSSIAYGSAMDIVDPSLEGDFNQESMRKLLSLAINCVDPIPARRPDITQVVRGITAAHELECPSQVLSRESELPSKKFSNPVYDTYGTIEESKDEGEDEEPDEDMLDVELEQIALKKGASASFGVDDRSGLLYVSPSISSSSGYEWSSRELNSLSTQGSESIPKKISP